MAQKSSPIAMRDMLQLRSLGVDASNFRFGKVVCSSEHYIAINEGNAIAVVETKSRNKIRLPIPVDSAIMNPTSKILALRKADPSNPNITNLQLYNLDAKKGIKTCQIQEAVVFWKWVNPSTIALVTNTAVYHWSKEGESQPAKMFDRAPASGPVQIINYRASADFKWLVLGGMGRGAGGITGALQVYSVAAGGSQPTMDSHAACFLGITLDGRNYKSNLFCFTKLQPTPKLNILEVGVDKNSALKHSIDFPIQSGDFPMAMLPDNKYGMVFVLTKQGFIFVFDAQSGTMILNQKASANFMFASSEFSDASSDGGIMTIDTTGRVCHFHVDQNNLVPYVTQNISPQLGLQFSTRFGIGGEATAGIFKQQFQRLVAGGQLQQAVKLAATSPGGSLRTIETINILKQAGGQNGQILLSYFQMLLQAGTLNEIESVELVKPVLMKGNQAGVDMIQKWISEGKLSASEDLGDLLKNANIKLALSVYLRAEVHEKVISCFLSMAAQSNNDQQANECFENVLAYSQKVKFSPDYALLVTQLARMRPQRAKDFACMLLQHPDGAKLEILQTVNLFMQQNDIKSTTEIILKYLRPRGDLEQDADLQTKVLELNLRAGQLTVVRAIFESPDYNFTQYDKIRIAQLCENAGLLQFALEHYTDMKDIKRVMARSHLIPLPYLIEFFGRLEPADALEILRDLMRASASRNIRLVLEVAKAHSDRLTSEALIALFEEFQAYNGLYFYLGAQVNTSEDPQVIFKFIEAATQLEQFAELQRVCAENKFYDAKEVKEFLLTRNLKDPRPLIHVCDKHGFIPELTQYLYSNKFEKFMYAYVQRMNSNSAPEVVGTLLDLNAPEEQVRQLMDGVRPDPSNETFVEDLVLQCERRNRLKLIRPWIEERIKEGSQDPHLHNGLCKIYIDLNHSPQQFLRENQFYDSLVIGKYCESRDPHLAMIAYRRSKGACDQEFINVTNQNGFFKDQARYLVEQQNLELWASVLSEENEFRRQVIDQVTATAVPESRNADEVKTAVKALMAASLPNELIELLERIILQSGEGEFAQNSHLQNLLILTAIKADKQRVMGYIDRLDNYDGPDIAKIALGPQYMLYEEAFFIYKKFKRGEECISVLLEQIKNMNRAAEFAEYWDKPEVWSILAGAQLREGMVVESIQSFLKADDATHFRDVILTGKTSEPPCYNELITYINMARTKVRDSFLDNELLFCYARTDRLTDMEEFIVGSHMAKLASVANQCFEFGLYQAAKILFKATNNNAKLAICFVNLGQFEEAVDAARQATSMDTWKAVCFACVDAKRFRVAAMCGLSIIVMMEHLPDVCSYYEERGHFDEIIALLDQGLNLDRVHQGIYTALGVMYSRYKEDKLMDHIKFYYQKLNMATLLQECRRSRHWPEVVFLYSHWNQYDNAIETMIEHSADCWDSKLFKEILQQANTEVAYRAIDFYMREHPLMLNELCLDAASKLDPGRVVHKVKALGHLPLIKKYLLNVQREDISTVNEALNAMFLEEDDFTSLRESIEKYHAFDQIALAQICEKHDLIEFRRISAYLYRINKKYNKSIEVCKRDSLWQDATETAAESSKPELAESLLRFFVAEGNSPSFAATLYSCYALLTADVVLELAWRNNLMDFAMPFLIQSVADYNTKLTTITKRLEEADKKQKEEDEARKQLEEEEQQLYDVGAPNLLAPPPGMGGGMDPMGGMGGMGGPGMGGGMPPIGGGMPPMGGGMPPMGGGMPPMGGGMPPMGGGMPPMGGGMGGGMGLY